MNKTQRPALLPGKLLNIESASKELNEYFDGGFSVSEIRCRILKGEWHQGMEYYDISNSKRRQIRIDVEYVKRSLLRS